MNTSFFAGNLLAYLRGLWRRRVRSYLPDAKAGAYRKWMARHLAVRSTAFPHELEHGLLSVLTAVWDGSPLEFLKLLAERIADQNHDSVGEWVLIDNGCSNPDLLAYLSKLKQQPWIKVHRLERNEGIIRGLRTALEQAGGRYVLPVDGDDLLYPDAFRVVTAYIQRHGYPPLLYSDEDKILRDREYDPYLKPDWDPVLLLNSAYTAHLGVMDRRQALELGVYSGTNAEGSPDWDAFLRFMAAGHAAVHIPEILYSWRAHALSTADDAANKDYISSSQRAALQRYLDSRDDGASFLIENNPLLPGAHFQIRRKQKADMQFRIVTLDQGDSREAVSLLSWTDSADPDEIVLFKAPRLTIETSEWRQEIQTILELHPDTVMVGGRILSDGRIRDAGQVWGGSRLVWSPDQGRPAAEPGYFAQVWKRRSVSSVAIHLCGVRASFLVAALQNVPVQATVGFAGAWFGAHAQRLQRRIVYTPFLAGVSASQSGGSPTEVESLAFRARYPDLIPDRRFYSPHFSLEQPFQLEASN